MNKLITIALAALLVTGCNNDNDTTNPAVQPEAVNSENAMPEYSAEAAIKLVGAYTAKYISPGSKPNSVTVTVSEERDDLCAAGKCGVAWVNVANARVPVVYQVIDGNWFLDGIRVNKDGETLYDIPRAEIRHVIERDNIQLGKINLPMEDYKMDRNTKGRRTIFFCDPGVRYCNESLRVIESVEGKHLFFIPVGTSDWAKEASALVLASPMKLRGDVFRFLGNAKDVRLEMLAGLLEKKMKITIKTPLLEKTRKSVQKGVDGAKSYGISKAPVVITSSGDVLVGAVRSDVLKRYLERTPDPEVSGQGRDGRESIVGKGQAKQAAMDSANQQAKGVVVKGTPEAGKAE